MPPQRPSTAEMTGVYFIVPAISPVYDSVSRNQYAPTQNHGDHGKTIPGSRRKLFGVPIRDRAAQRRLDHAEESSCNYDLIGIA